MIIGLPAYAIKDGVIVSKTYNSNGLTLRRNIQIYGERRETIKPYKDMIFLVGNDISVILKDKILFVDIPFSEISSVVVDKYLEEL